MVCRRHHVIGKVKGITKRQTATGKRQSDRQRATGTAGLLQRSVLCCENWAADVYALEATPHHSFEIR